MSATIIHFNNKGVAEAALEDGARLKRLRDVHDGFRVATEIGALAVEYQCPSRFQEALWTLVEREAAAAEREILSGGIVITTTGSPDDKPAA